MSTTNSKSSADSDLRRASRVDSSHPDRRSSMILLSLSFFSFEHLVGGVLPIACESPTHRLMAAGRSSERSFLASRRTALHVQTSTPPCPSSLRTSTKIRVNSRWFMCARMAPCAEELVHSWRRDTRNSEFDEEARGGMVGSDVEVDIAGIVDCEETSRSSRSITQASDVRPYCRLTASRMDNSVGWRGDELRITLSA